MMDIKLPEIGDGIESGDVLELLVSEGDMIEAGQDLIELETDKATTGIPSPQAGKIVKIHVHEGETIPIGGTIVTLEPVGATTPSDSPPPAPADKQPTTEPPAAIASKTETDESDQRDTPATSPAPPEPPLPVAPAEPQSPPAQPAASPAAETSTSGIAAGPAIRRFARELGIDLTQVQGTGKSGRITREDVLAKVRNSTQGQTANEGSASNDEWGPIRREKLNRVRKTIAAKMSESWETVPRVTNFDDADVTELEEFRQSSKADYAKEGIKLTSMPFVIKAVAMALRANPTLNASLDMEQNEVVYKQYINVGIAIDTERGLVVPPVRNVEDRSVSEIARELKRVVDSIREQTFGVEDLRGSTFTISNLGAIGGTYSTPIINVPEVAILLLGRSRKIPVVVQDEVQVRMMMPLSLSYDHRLVDGGAAARFLNDLIGYLEAPSRLLLAP